MGAKNQLEAIRHQISFVFNDKIRGIEKLPASDILSRLYQTLTQILRVVMEVDWWDTEGGREIAERITEAIIEVDRMERLVEAIKNVLKREV